MDLSNFIVYLDGFLRAVFLNDFSKFLAINRAVSYMCTRGTDCLYLPQQFYNAKIKVIIIYLLVLNEVHFNKEHENKTFNQKYKEQ